MRTAGLRRLSHPGWFGGVMGTAALSRALVGADFGPLSRAIEIVSVLLLGLAAAGFLAAAAALVAMLRHTGTRLREHVLSPLLGPLYAAVPGSVFALLLALLGHHPGLLAASPVRYTVMAAVVLVLAGALWLTVAFFVSAFEEDAFEAHSISGTWFLPETAVMLAVLVLFALSDAETGRARLVLAAATIVVTGAGFVLFMLTAALFFGRLVLVRQHHEPGVASMWIMMSPLSVSSLALGAAAGVLPVLAGVDEALVVALVSLGSGLLWGFGLWWLAAALVVTFHRRQEALRFTPASWAYVFPLAALSLAAGNLGAVWGSAVVAGAGTVLALLTLTAWVFVVRGAVAWLIGGAANGAAG